MAITAALVAQGNNRLRYLVTATDTSALAVNITTTGAATPDLRTDTPNNGPLHAMSLLVANGYGKLAAGVQTQAKARAVWLSDDPTNLVGSSNIPRAVCRITSRTGGMTAIVDANVSGSDPILTITLSAAGSAYLDVEVQGVTGAN